MGQRLSLGFQALSQKYQKRIINFMMSACVLVRLSLSLSLCPFVCLSAWSSSARTVRIFMKFGTYGFLEKSVAKI
jgi:hypothetical protein